MGRIRRRRLKAITEDEDGQSGSVHTFSPNPGRGEAENVVEDSWVIVKKQKIRIWIPPLDSSVANDHGCSISKSAHVGQSTSGKIKHSRGKMRIRKISNETPMKLCEFGSRRESSLEHVEPQSPAATPGVIQYRRRIKNNQGLIKSRNTSKQKKTLRSSTAKSRLHKPSNVAVDSKPEAAAFQLKQQEVPGVGTDASLDLIKVNTMQVEKASNEEDDNNLREESNNLVTKSEHPNRLPVSEIENLPSCSYRQSNGYMFGKISHDQNIAALVLVRKLEMAGGLSNWLMSKGLGRFLEMFQRENFNEVELMNLTMDRLKDMGAVSVGPRRKLIHAIGCLTQP